MEWLKKSEFKGMAGHGPVNGNGQHAAGDLHGGGAAGNRPAGAITQLVGSLPRISSIENLTPMSGGTAAGVYVPYPIRVTVGGATVFVLEVSQFLKV